MENNNISAQQTAKVHLHNEQDHIKGDNKPEKAQVDNEGINELNVCKICQRRFCSEEELIIHKLRRLSKNYCCVCGKVHKNSSALGEHIKKHADDSRYVCGASSKEFKRNEQLNRAHKRKALHLKNHISNICARNLAHSISAKFHTLIHDKKKPEPEEHYITGDTRKLEEDGQTVSDHNENNVIMKVEPEEPQIVEAKWEQEEHCDIGDARKLDPNEQTITGCKENNIFMKVEPEEPQIIKQERVYPQIVYEI